MTKRRGLTYKDILIPAWLLVAGCSATNYLPEEEKLYTGARVETEATQGVKERKVKNTIRSVVRPEPNSSFLGMRPKLWLYMRAGGEPSTGIGRWLKEKGEPPVYISEVRPEATAEIIDASLFNRGFFNSHTETERVEKEKTASVIYRTFLNEQYRTGKLTYSISDDSLRHIILSDSSRSVITPGDPYSLDMLKGERARIDADLKNRGYYYFSPDHLLFRADTSAEDRTVALQLTLKESIPEREKVLSVYRINHVVIDQAYSLTADQGSAADTLNHQGYLFLRGTDDMKIRPEVILESVFLRKGDRYSRQQHAKTLNRLMSLGNFRFVQLLFTDSDTSAAGFLDVRILLTGMPERSFRAEMDVVSKSNNFTGPRMNVSLQNRNAFGGAEQLNLSMAGSFEAQMSGKERNLFSYSVSPQAELVFPRFVVPFATVGSKSIYIPRTRLSLSYQFLKRVNYFNMNSLQFLYGYMWKANRMTDHELNPVNISYTSLSNRSETFTGLLDANPALRASYQEMFIAGSSYSFTYNGQTGSSGKMQYYLNARVEAAGNLFSLVNTITGDSPSPEEPATIAGSVYSQFAKAGIDARAYYTAGKSDKLALRLFAGVAKSYGNANVLPYSRQFFSGGPNSIRAFQINSVGPGTALQESAEIGYFQMGGDIKLELNAEYRFTIYNIFKGALFADAGNIWLQQSNPAAGGESFAISRVPDELAVGAGLGLRVDVSFFILRFDLAMPLRKPWLEEGSRWVTDEPEFWSPAWRRDNLVLNVAIGYPF
ncbi:MAG: BamA/TamA family outer membrane protein [Bacteroidales bacterium]|nr:BamA/TamA family outer membrane protein [Bacteroidales bacterium]